MRRYIKVLQQQEGWELLTILIWEMCVFSSSPVRWKNFLLTKLPLTDVYTGKKRWQNAHTCNIRHWALTWIFRKLALGNQNIEMYLWTRMCVLAERKQEHWVAHREVVDKEVSTRQCAPSCQTWQRAFCLCLCTSSCLLRSGQGTASLACRRHLAQSHSPSLFCFLDFYS